jgi:hypothetical protein
MHVGVEPQKRYRFWSIDEQGVDHAFDAHKVIPQVSGESQVIDFWKLINGYEGVHFPLKCIPSD